MELKMENGQNTKTNPWIVETLDVYLHYCCPECDHKTKTKTLFVKHVFSTHPDAKGNLLRGIDNYSLFQTKSNKEVAKKVTKIHKHLVKLSYSAQKLQF